MEPVSSRQPHLIPSHQEDKLPELQNHTRDILASFQTGFPEVIPTRVRFRETERFGPPSHAHETHQTLCEPLRSLITTNRRGEDIPSTQTIWLA